jgi:hypothetical protein
MLRVVAVCYGGQLMKLENKVGVRCEQKRDTRNQMLNLMFWFKSLVWMKLILPRTGKI